jgi:hypothetical protein
VSGGAKYQPGQHGVPPLGRAYRRRLLLELQRRADAGDVQATEALVRLSIQIERGAKAGAEGMAARITLHG